MASGEIHKGDIGTILEFTITDQDGVVVDVSSASTKQIFLRSPYGKILTKTAAFTTTGGDGKIKYVTISGDIDAPGEWKAQAYVVTSAGSWKTDSTTFTVYANIS